MNNKILYGIACLALTFAMICGMPVKAFAAFTDTHTVQVNNIEAATYTIDISNKTYEKGTHTLTLDAKGTASTGYGMIKIADTTYYTEQISPSETFILKIKAEENIEIDFASSWGKSPLLNEGATEELYGNGDTIIISEPDTNPFAGKKISVMGDSISTYTGWSDAHPITDESCKYRYGEAYYGPEGGDFHNTELLVDDTWWYQAAQELGAEILISNAGNSTGLLHASYPLNAEWQQYLQEMLAYKSRPYYLGTEEEDPDIIALYIGSSDVASVSKSKFGSVDEIDYDALIKDNGDGTYTYAEPVTVAEAYSILLHKISVTYPDAEVYCFTVVPNSGGTVKTINTRLAAAVPFNKMVRGVAEKYGAIVVDIFEEFGIDPERDAIATQEDVERFKSYFNGDPHPNAAGFDVITKRFVSTVLENSKYR